MGGGGVGCTGRVGGRVATKERIETRVADLDTALAGLLDHRVVYVASSKLHLSVHAGAEASVAADLALAASATVVTSHRSTP